ncbi:lycopene beta-cyclase CrtY [Hellea balneolensis]|uniref:lycopene beta-cyclase CrtY n=1 Tax=Hellea balneolensis TaxID=287478 RepID=UPI00047AB34F|nr:lycopene beta-cyclase CrtY [Hellea balneolensis]
MPDIKADMIIVGAGLSGLITAWRCLDVHPELNVIVIEASDVVGGDHTWSFNMSDILEHLQDWIKPFIAHQWDDYDVKFPKRKRRLEITYCTGNSDTLRACVQPHIESGRLKVMSGTQALDVQPYHVVLENEQRLSAKCVLDARGFKPNDDVVLGYQKFVGHVIRTQHPHGVKRPIIMDATVEQLGGYRFVYCLPYSETEILVEDTYYTDGSELKSQEVDARLKDYIRDSLGVKNYSITRREIGVLPITLAVDEAFGTDVSGEKTEPAKLGMTGGYYHAVTGYSLPEAVKSANVVCDMIEKNKPDFGAAVLHEMAYHRVDHYHEEKFLRLLNRMLFRAAKPTERYKVLQRFYGLSEGLIERFYRNRLTKLDKLRILIGKPPVPVSNALKNLSESAFLERERK